MILLVSNERDITTDYLVIELKRRALPFFRLNSERLPLAKVRMAGWPQEAWSIEFADRRLEGGAVKAAYFRRPGHPTGDPDLSPEDGAYCEMEWQAFMKALYARLEGRWLSSPRAIVMAEDKPLQLLVAHRLGFEIPTTVVTNDSAALRTVETPIAKPLRQALLHGDTEAIMFTTRLDEGRLAVGADALQFAPVVLQTEIRKAADIRVTVVADQVFAASIASQGNSDTEVDWRRGADPAMPHAAIELPSEISDRCIKLVAALGLGFGAIDLILDRVGRYWFLEINPNGQWAWIQNRVGHQIAGAIVDRLLTIAET